MVNVVIPLAMAALTRVEYIALWLGTRAAAQLLVAVLPNPIHALLQSQGGELSAAEACKLRRAAPLYLCLVSLLVFAAAFAILETSGAVRATHSPGLSGILSAFAAILFFSFGSLGILRVAQRADLMFSVNLLDFVLSLLCLPFLFLGFGPFVIAASVKEVVRIACVIPLFGAPSLQLPPFRPMILGLSQYLRGVAQVGSQYLERTAFPFIFGLNTAGLLGMGSTMGVLPVMLSSNIYTWAFPRIAADDQPTTHALIAEWSRLLLLASSLCWWLAGGVAVTNLQYEGWPIIAVGATFTGVLGISFLATARSRDALLGKSSSLIQLTALAGVYAAVGLSVAAGAPVLVALAVGIAVSVGYTLWVASELETSCANRLSSHATLALVSVTTFVAFAAEGDRWTGVVSVLVAASLATPYAVALFRSRLG